MKKVTYQDIREELIEVGVRARATFGSNLDQIRSHARDRGVTLTWGQESDVLLSIQTLFRARMVELNADAGTAPEVDAATGLSDVRKSSTDGVPPHRWGRRRQLWRNVVFDALRRHGDPRRRSQNDEHQRQFRT